MRRWWLQSLHHPQNQSNTPIGNLHTQAGMRIQVLPLAWKQHKGSHKRYLKLPLPNAILTEHCIFKGHTANNILDQTDHNICRENMQYEYKLPFGWFDLRDDHQSKCKSWNSTRNQINSILYQLCQFRLSKLW